LLYNTATPLLVADLIAATPVGLDGTSRSRAAGRRRRMSSGAAGLPLLGQDL